MALADQIRVLNNNRHHTLKFLSTGEYIDAHTEKPVYGKVICEYTAPGARRHLCPCIISV